MNIEKILLIDDNEADNVFHEIVLREAGFTGEVQVFELATEALKVLSNSPDAPGTRLILLDINMPGMDGWQFAEAATLVLAGHSTVIVVMLTSSANDDDRRRAREIKIISGFLTKPLTEAFAHELLAGNWQNL